MYWFSTLVTPCLLNIIISAAVGGMGTIVGPIAGGYFLTFIVEYLRPFLLGAWRFLTYAIIAVIVIVYKPRGFYGIAQDIGNWLQGRRRRGEQYG